jgi:hypothetical protein
VGDKAAKINLCTIKTVLIVIGSMVGQAETGFQTIADTT